MDYVLIDGDEAIFELKFGDATIIPNPGQLDVQGKGTPGISEKLEATGPTTLSGKKVCVQGNESSVSVDGCSYSANGFVNGIGKLTITRIENEHVATKSSSGNKKLLLVGTTLTAELTPFEACLTVDVNKPAKNSYGASDPTGTYSGRGVFKTTNTKFRAT